MEKLRREKTKMEVILTTHDASEEVKEKLANMSNEEITESLKQAIENRSEERRVGKECREQWKREVSSRRRHTRYIGDWSSDVCSSDLTRNRPAHPDSKVKA